MNHPLNDITPIAKEQKSTFLRPAGRIIKAQRLMHKIYHRVPIQRDFFAEHEAVVAWGSITCSYSGIEQAMKCLLKMQNTYTKEKHWNHYIGKLFQDLVSEEQAAIRLSYQVYRSLHNYIPFETVDDFLNSIDKGYNKWRYLLLEGQKSVNWPKTHPGAMLEIWSALSDILTARVFTNHGLHTIKDRIDFYLREMHWKSGLPPNQVTDLETMNEVAAWLQNEHFVGINAYSNLFYCHKNERPLYIKENNSILPIKLTIPSVLSRFIQEVKQRKNDSDFSYYLYRAENKNLTWNSEQSLFI